MEKKPLTGIERELVLRYLLDGNVPVTITPVFSGENCKENEHLSEPDFVNSAVVPVEFKPEDISVLKEGIVLLKDAPESIAKYADKPVKVEFYFNRVGLYFITALKTVSSGLALVIPAEINRVPDIPVNKKYDFTAQLIFSVSNEGNSKFLCVPADGFELFTRPVWSSIELERQQQAKKLLEDFLPGHKVLAPESEVPLLLNGCKDSAQSPQYLRLFLFSKGQGSSGSVISSLK